MFVKSFITAAVVMFVVAGAVILPAYSEEEPRTADFTTVPSHAEPAVPVGALDVARDHARQHGLIDCVDPAHARLDDVVLTVPSGPDAELVIVPVDFDEALESGERGPWNVLACRVGPGVTSAG